MLEVHISKRSLFRLKITVGCRLRAYPSIHLSPTLSRSRSVVWCVVWCVLLCCGGACVWCVVKLGTLSLRTKRQLKIMRWAVVDVSSWGTRSSSGCAKRHAGAQTSLQVCCWQACHQDGAQCQQRDGPQVPQTALAAASLPSKWQVPSCGLIRLCHEWPTLRRKRSHTRHVHATGSQRLEFRFCSGHLSSCSAVCGTVSSFFPLLWLRLRANGR